MSIAMNEYRNVSNSSTIVVRTVCATVFFVVSFCYLYFYQSPILAVEQRLLLHDLFRCSPNVGAHFSPSLGAQYSPFLGALLITLAMVALQHCMFAVQRYYRRSRLGLHALTYLPSFILLWYLTDMPVLRAHDDSNVVLWWVVRVLLLAAAIVLPMLLRSCRAGVFSALSRRISTANIYLTNLLLMIAMSVALGLLGNGDKSLHCRARMERCLAEGRAEDALKVCDFIKEDEVHVNMLRFYALAMVGELGEKMFARNFSSATARLLPMDGEEFLIYPSKHFFGFLGAYPRQGMTEVEYLQKTLRQGLGNIHTWEYLLCAHLLRSDLHAFARDYLRSPFNGQKLPRHFREALLLYNRHSASPVSDFKDRVMAADFRDFLSLYKRNKDPRLRYSSLREMYGNSYWFYYYYSNSGKLSSASH